MERSCNECGYPLTGNEERCPECGTILQYNQPQPTKYSVDPTTNEQNDYKTVSELFWSCQFYQVFKGHTFDLGQRTYEFGSFLWEMIVLTWHTVWSKFAKFSGRASRREYWSFCFGVPFLCIIPLFFFIAIIPYIAVGIRRMHDTNHCGWWVCVPFAVFFLSLKKSDPIANKYGNPTTL